jgi:hypothetical protein
MFCMSDTSTAATPGWVKVLGTVALAVAVLVAILHLTGNGMGHHHHDRHPGDDAGAAPTEGGHP